jgi:hypothetical protein
MDEWVDEWVEGGCGWMDTDRPLVYRHIYRRRTTIDD